MQWCVSVCVYIYLIDNDTGLGDLADFYVFSVFSLNGLMAGVLFLLGTLLRCHPASAILLLISHSILQ